MNEKLKKSILFWLNLDQKYFIPAEWKNVMDKFSSM